MLARDDIIRMAREANWADWEIAGMTRHLKQFAELVAEAAVAEEREACAKVCEKLQAPPYVSMSDASMWDVATMECSEAIRARGQQ